MKTKDICKQYGIDRAAFEGWLRNSGVTFKTSTLGAIDVDETQDIAAMVESFKTYYAEWQEKQRLEAEEAARVAAASAAEAKEAEDKKQRAMASMLITSGFSFDGYTITKYSGYISGDDVVEVDRGTTTARHSLDALVHIRRNALFELKEAAYALGCNAVIGVDFDYLTLDNTSVTGTGGTMFYPYIFGVTANGNAVIIEKNDR